MTIKNDPTLSKFLAAGAQCVAGNVMLGQTTVALLRDGIVILTPEGEVERKRLFAKAAVEDAVVKNETVKPAAAAKKSTKVTPPAAPVAIQPPNDAIPEAAAAVDLDAMLVAQGLATSM